MGNYTIFTCSKFLGEAGKQEILEPKVPKILDLKSNLVPRAFPLIIFREKPWGRGCLKSSSEQVFSENWRCIDFEEVNGALKILHIRSKNLFWQFWGKIQQVR